MESTAAVVLIRSFIAKSSSVGVGSPLVRL